MVKLTSTSRVALISTMGDDLTVVNAARVSFAKESEYAPDKDNVAVLKMTDAKLIAYLARNHHWTPFAHTMFTFRIACPIFVARQWFRHTIGVARNEVSRRYVDEEVEYFLPEIIRAKPEASIKQGSAGTHEFSDYWRSHIEIHYAAADRLYTAMIADGVAPEQARIVLPLGHMTEFYETGSLAFYMRCATLRLDPHAQSEIRDLMELLGNVIAPLCPVSWATLPPLG